MMILNFISIPEKYLLFDSPEINMWVGISLCILLLVCGMYWLYQEGRYGIKTQKKTIITFLCVGVIVLYLFSSQRTIEEIQKKSILNEIESKQTITQIDTSTLINRKEYEQLLLNSDSFPEGVYKYHPHKKEIVDYSKPHNSIESITITINRKDSLK
jgi:hypothetical protein